jgi:hypothetical protein
MMIIVAELNESFKWFRFYVESAPDTLMDILPDKVTFMHLRAEEWKGPLLECWRDPVQYEEDFLFFLSKEKQTGAYFGSLGYQIIQKRLKWPIVEETLEQYNMRLEMESGRRV